MGMRPSDADHLAWLSEAGITSFKGLSLLDLGCGSGFLCEKAKNEGAVCPVGVDIEEPQNCGGWTFLNANLDGRTWGEAVKAAAGKEGFDLILAFDILEHLEAPYLFLMNCKNLLSAQGVLVLTTPNALSWERFAKPETWSGARDPQHKVLFNKYTLGFLLARVGLKSRSLKAPVRSLRGLKDFAPQIGGQILAVAHL